MIATTRTLATATILSLSLALAACGKGDDKTGSKPSAMIEKVAPPAGKAWGDVVVKTPEGGYRMGNPEASIKLVEYASYSCSHCAEFSEKGAAILKDTFVGSGRVSYELRNFVRDPIDLSVALLARCGTPESFFALSEQAFANQKAMFQTWEATPVSAKEAVSGMAPGRRLVVVARMAGLSDFFAARGIAADQGNACLANTAEAERLSKATQTDGDTYKIEGTPTFLINGNSIGSMGWEELKAKLETMGAR